MQTKLTLTIDRSVIEQAKKYARARRSSVSKIVEDYFRNISRNSDTGEVDLTKAAPITQSLMGMFHSEYQGQEYKDLLEGSLLDRHL
jgi:hypothetical protein